MIRERKRMRPVNRLYRRAVNPRCSLSHLRSARSGFAVLMVVLVLAGLAIIAGPFVVSMIFHQSQSKHLLGAERARLAARTAASHAIAQLLRTDMTYEFDTAGCTPYSDTQQEYQVSFDELIQGTRQIVQTRNPNGTMLSVEVSDEQSKVNLNTAPLLLLQNLLEEIIPAKATLANEIIFYRSSVAQFRSVDDLSALGNLPQLFPYRAAPSERFTPEDIEFLRRYLTTQSAKGININTAPREVIISELVGLSHKKAGTGAGQLQQLGSCGGQPNTNCGNGTISQISFPAGYRGEDWTIRCTGWRWNTPDYRNPNRERIYTFTATGQTSGTMPNAYEITDSSSSIYIADGGQISFVITAGTTPFEVGDGWFIPSQTAGQGGTDVVSHDEAVFLAGYFTQSATLAQDVSPGTNTIVVNEDISKFPDPSQTDPKLPDACWLTIDGDAVQYTAKDNATRSFTITTDLEDGITRDHKAGAEVRLLYTGLADVEAVLLKALADASTDDTIDPQGQITSLGTLTFSADDADSIYLNAANPLDPLLINHTELLLFRAFGFFTITATGIVNDPSGNQIAKESIREVVQATPPDVLKWQLTSQADFLEMCRIGNLTTVSTFPVPTSIRDLSEDKHYAYARPVAGALSRGNTTVPVADTSQFRIGRRVRISGVDSNGDFHEEYHNVRSIGPSSITLDGGLLSSYATATVGDAGDVRILAYHPLPDPTTRTIFNFNDKTKDDVLDADWTPGTARKQSGLVTWQDVQVEGVNIDSSKVSGTDGPLAYRADDGLFATVTNNLGLRLASGWIEFWFKPQWYDRSRIYYLFDYAQRYFQNRLTVFYQPTTGNRGRLVFCLADSTLEPNFAMIVVPVNNSATGLGQGEIAIIDDVWYHLQAVWKGSGYGQLALFIDGKSVGTYWPSAILGTPMNDTTSGGISIDKAEISGLYGFPQEFNVPAGCLRIEDELINYDQISETMFNIPVDAQGSPMGRGQRITRAAAHQAGAAVVPFGYVRSLDKRLYAPYVNAEYPDDRLLNATTAVALAEAMPAANPQTTIDLTATVGPFDHDNDAGTPDITVTSLIKCEADAEGPNANPVTTNINNHQLTATATLIPIADATGFQSSGYVYIRDPQTGAEERAYYESIEVDKELIVMLEDSRCGTRGFKIKRTCLIVAQQPSSGRGVLDTTAQTFTGVEAVAQRQQVTLCSMLVNNDNVHYARGYFTPQRTISNPPPPDPPGGWGDPPPWWPQGRPWPPSSNWSAFSTVGERSQLAYVEVGNEWIGYNWPSMGADGAIGGGDDLIPTWQGQTGNKYYFVGARGLARTQSGTAAEAHGAGDPVYPVFFAGGYRLGPGDRVTLRDDRGTEEEKRIKWANPGGYLASFGNLNNYQQSEFLAGNYLYSKNPRVLKFPTGDLPAITSKDDPPQEQLWIGSQAAVEGNPPYSPACAVIDGFRISAGMHNTMRLYAVSPRSTYSDSDGDGNPDPPTNKRPTDAERINTVIGSSDSVPFTIKVGHLAEFQTGTYPNPFWDTNRQGQPYPPFMWTGHDWGWPRQGYLKIDDEVMYYHTPYWMGDLRSMVATDLDITATTITIKDPPGTRFPNRITDYPEQGYLGITARQPNRNYRGHEYFDKYVRDQYGQPIPISVNVASPYAVRCPMNQTCSCGLWHYSGYIGDEWMRQLGMTPGDFHPYEPEYLDVSGYHWEVIFYARKSDSSHSFQDCQRGCLDTVPYEYNVGDPFAGAPPVTFVAGVNTDPNNPNVWIAVHDEVGVEREILARGCLGTKPAKHTIGSVVMPLENISATHLVDTYNNGSLAVEQDTRPWVNAALNDRFPWTRGVLRLEDRQGNHEVVCYSGYNSTNFTGVQNFRQRYGTSPLALLDNTNFGQKATGRQDVKTDPTPWYGTGTSMSSFDPIIVTLLPWRYWDGCPSPDAQTGIRDYNAPGSVYFEASRTIKGAEWRGITWEDTLPPSAQPSFNLRVVVRIGGTRAPAWNADPDADPNDGLFEFMTNSANPAKRPPVRRTSYPARQAYEDALKTMYNLGGFRGDDIQVRVFFEYPPGAYNLSSWAVNDWKKCPFLDTMIITYKGPSGILESENLSF